MNILCCLARLRAFYEIFERNMPELIQEDTNLVSRNQMYSIPLIFLNACLNVRVLYFSKDERKFQREAYLTRNIQISKSLK